jgi:choline monooxygenase
MSTTPSTRTGADDDGSTLTGAEQQYPLPPTVMDAARYTDPEQFERERREIFLKRWMSVCPSSDVAEPRDILVWDKLKQSVLIARQDDGGLSAWHNVCQHRGARLVRGTGASRCEQARIHCPWHGFTYDLDGKVTAVPLRPTFDAELLDGLRTPRVRCEEWGGWIWLCFSEEEPPLVESLGEIGELLSRYETDGWTVTHRTSIELPTSWKIAMDAFLETWHVPFTHKETLGGLVLWRDAVIRLCEPHSWMTLPLRGFTEKVESDDVRDSHICHFLAYPNTIFSCFPTHMQMWHVWPIAVDRCELIAYEFVGPAPDGTTDEQWAQRNERDWTSFLHVLEEDTDVLKQLPTVIESEGYRRSMFCTAESRLTLFHEENNRRSAPAGARGAETR